MTHGTAAIELWAMRRIACWEWKESSWANLDDPGKLGTGFRGCPQLTLLEVPGSRRVPDLAFAANVSAAPATFFKPAGFAGHQTVADRDGADALQAGPQVDSLRAFSVTSMPRWVHRS